MKKRYLTFGIDFIIACLIQAIMMFLFIIQPLIRNSLSSDNVFPGVVVLTLVSMTFLIIRDTLGEKSLGKYLLNLKIIDRISIKQASVFQRLIRNIFWLLGPIEIIVFFVKGKRIGDIISNTEVIAIVN